MSSFLDRIGSRAQRLRGGGKKTFTQPPFWTNNLLTAGAPWSTPDMERIENDFLGYVQGAYKANGPVFACIAARQAIFSQVRFGWRTFKNMRPTDLFGTKELALLEKPWGPGTSSSTIDLLARMEPVASLAGNFYATKCDDNGKLGGAATGPGQRIVHMRPDWVSIIIGSPSDDPYDLRAKAVGYMYEPMGSQGTGGYNRADAVLLLPSEVCHFAPLPDPEMRYRGMSWLTPIIREIQADSAATKHKDVWFKNGATLRTVVRFDKDTSPDSYDAFVARFQAAHQGSDNAYKTLFLGGGADVSVVGADMKQMDFKTVQGGGETRIAAAAGVHPVIVGLSEGLQGSSLNAGNFGAARRLVADKTLRHLWGTASSSLQNLLTPPSEAASLWYDTRDVAFLREDTKDAADIQGTQASTMRQLVDGGWEPESVKAAIINEDWSLLVHTGQLSVQLQEPGASQNNQGGEPGAGKEPAVTP